MGHKLFYIILSFGFFVSSTLFAQLKGLSNQTTEKIRGTRFVPSPNHGGKPYLYDKFMVGEIEFNDGTKIQNIGLNYSTYLDELIYYNPAITSQIQIDKISLKGFSFIDDYAKNRVFRRQFCAPLNSECYLEILSQGKISLLVYRKFNLEQCETYISKTGLAYQPAFIYFIYNEDNKYTQVNLSRNSLLSKFNKPDQKLVKKALRKNGIYISDESSFIRAWKLIEQSGIPISF